MPSTSVSKTFTLTFTVHAVKRFHALFGAVALPTLCLAACARAGTEAPVTTDAPFGAGSTPTPTPLDGNGAPSPSPTPPPVGGPSATATPTPTSAPRSLQGRSGGFVPLDDPAFIPVSAAAFLDDDELVLGYDRDGEARAYPVSMMFWHHIINDTVQGRPLLVTY